MKHASRTAITPASSQAVRTRLAWVLRVMVIFLLIFDQISAPLHNHVQDVGPDGVALQFMLSDAHASSSHIEQSDVSAPIEF